MAFVRAEFMSYSLKRIVPITVVLPCDRTNFRNLGPEPADPPYKTLYLLHGIYGSDMDLVAGTNIQRMAREHQIAVVMPAGENHFYTDAGNTGGQYGQFIGEELVEVTRKMFRLSYRREDTYIAGLSMGGYGAYMNALKYHNVFSHAACLSMAMIDRTQDWSQIPPMNDSEFVRSVFGAGDFDKNLKSQRSMTEKCLMEGTPFPELYFAVGKQDILYDANVRFHAYLEEKGVSHIFSVSEGGHEFEFWGRALAEVLDWLPHPGKLVLEDSGNVFGAGKA